MNKKNGFFVNGIWKENPILVSLLGLCSTLGVTTTVENAIGMSVAFAFVLILSNVIISLIRKIVPSEIRIPIFIVVVATLVTLVEMLMHAFVPALYLSLGIWIPLIVVNCIILGRAEAFAQYNTVSDSLKDALGMSVGYAGVLLLLALVRGFLSDGSVIIWGDIGFKLGDGKIFTDFFVDEPAAFIFLGLFIGIANLINNRLSEKGASK
jgi:electron transport complex protein RnfE